jgi:hypothetical protein
MLEESEEQEEKKGEEKEKRRERRKFAVLHFYFFLLSSPLNPYSISEGTLFLCSPRRIMRGEKGRMTHAF